jgi:alpha-N-arabinofuranosidase
MSFYIYKPAPDPVWGVVDPNTFGTDEFVEWCRLIGSEPYICTNAGNGTPEEMKEWVEYCNATKGPLARMRAAGGHEEPLNVRYWSIGNENWGGHEIGASTPEKWGPLVHRSAELMLDADPKLTLLAAATPDRAWTLPLLKAAGEHLSFVCIHEYWLGFWAKNEMPGYLPCIIHSEGPERTIRRTRDILREAGVLGRIKIAFDEWNLRGWHHPGFPRKQVDDGKDPAVAGLIARREDNAIPSQYSMADALFAASFLNACLRHAEDIGMANIAPIVNTRGPLLLESLDHALPALFLEGLFLDHDRVAPDLPSGGLPLRPGPGAPLAGRDQGGGEEDRYGEESLGHHVFLSSFGQAA